METCVSSLLGSPLCQNLPEPGTAPAIREAQSQQEDEVTDHNYYAGCEVRCASGAGTTRLATSTGKSKALFEVSTQTTDHAVGRGCDPCLAVKERLRLRATL